MAARIDTLIFVTGRHKRAIEDHFDHNIELEIALAAKQRYEALEAARHPLPDHVQCLFVRQNAPEGLGHEVLQAHKIIGDEPESADYRAFD